MVSKILMLLKTQGCGVRYIPPLLQWFSYIWQSSYILLRSCWLIISDCFGSINVYILQAQQGLPSSTLQQHLGKVIIVPVDIQHQLIFLYVRHRSFSFVYFILLLVPSLLCCETLNHKSSFLAWNFLGIVFFFLLFSTSGRILAGLVMVNFCLIFQSCLAVREDFCL